MRKRSKNNRLAGGKNRVYPRRATAGLRIRLDAHDGIKRDRQWRGDGVLYRPDTSTDIGHPWELRGLENTGLLQEMLTTDPIAYGLHQSNTSVLQRGFLNADPNVDGATDATRKTADFWDWQFDRLGMRAIIELASAYMPLGFVAAEPVLQLMDSPFGRVLAVARLEPRLPQSVSWWLEDGAGNLAGIVQGRPYQDMRVIDINRALLWTNQRTHYGPEGLAMLRPAYFAWQAKRDLQLGEANMWERFGKPLPYFQQTAQSGFDDAARTQLENDIDEFFATGYGGIVGPEGMDLKLWSPAHAAPDIASRIETWNSEILMVSSALWMVSGEHGTRNSTGEQRQAYQFNLESKLGYIGEQFVADGVPGAGLFMRLARYNFPDVTQDTPMPKIRAGGIRQTDVDNIVKNIGFLVQSGALTSSEQLQRWLYDLMDAPPDVYEVQNGTSEVVEDSPGVDGQGPAEQAGDRDPR